MRHLLVSFLTLCLAASGAHAQAAGGAPADPKTYNPNLVTVDEKGESRFTLGFGGRNWRGEDPRKAEKAEKEAKEAKKQAAAAPPPPVAIATKPAAPKEEKKKLRSDGALKSDVVKKPAPPSGASGAAAASASPTQTPTQPNVPLPVVPGAK